MTSVLDTRAELERIRGMLTDIDSEPRIAATIQKQIDPANDPRPSIGSIILHLMYAGCYWQNGDTPACRRRLSKAEVALAALRVRLTPKVHQ